MKTGLYCAFIIAVCGSACPVFAADATESLAAAVPAEVSEVVSGGTWTEGSANGVYRAMVVSTPAGDGQQANVVVQILSLASPNAVPKVIKSVVIKEVADKKLPNAFLAMDAETVNEMTLIVSAYGAASDQDTSLHLKFNGSGAYEILPASGEEAPADADPKN